METMDGGVDDALDLGKGHEMILFLKASKTKSVLSVQHKWPLNF
jgi:hypothetical protein